MLTHPAMFTHYIDLVLCIVICLGCLPNLVWLMMWPSRV